MSTEWTYKGYIYEISETDQTVYARERNGGNYLTFTFPPFVRSSRSSLRKYKHPKGKDCTYEEAVLIVGAPKTGGLAIM